MECLYVWGLLFFVIVSRARFIGREREKGMLRDDGACSRSQNVEKSARGGSCRKGREASSKWTRNWSAYSFRHESEWSKLKKRGGLRVRQGSENLPQICPGWSGAPILSSWRKILF